MRHFFTLIAALLVSAFTYAQKPQTVPGDLIVQLVAGKSMDHVLQSNQLLNGQPTGIRVNRMLSPQMRAYLVQFDPQVNNNAMLQQVFAHPAVSAVQFNHVIQNRNTPNDPQLGQQWHHINANDADVDSELAWDITTGGLTALGDTIVVCIVDDGTRFNHPDLVDNQWVNHNEIPDNNIDDDGNGYVDDYFGWNPEDDNDDVNSGSHGVDVAGMVGARGNNSTGVVGVNWHVKLMTVTYGNLDDASVVEAYTYPLTMRQLYAQSGGTKGAFVVATNSSWGINNGNPADAPIWCAFYDTLGAYGILSAGATANAQINVDVNGDLPTGCASDYMISVTATNDVDVRTFSGFGLTTIDLGAPGEDVRTTTGSNGYGTTSGTSFASPMVAGAIALLYSAPCVSLAAIAHADPELAAQYVRQYLLDGVDVVPNLVGYTVTGGRLNLRGALDQLIINCEGAGCIAPLNVNVSGVTDVQGSVTWSSVPNILGFDVRYGLIGGNDTLTAFNVTSPFLMTELVACSNYWVSVRSNCETDSSAWSADKLFASDGCCVPPPNISVLSIQETTATANWGSVFAAQSYLVQWREVGTQIWQEQNNVTTTTFAITTLQGCTEYEVRVATNCVGSTTSFISAGVFRTLGCGACTDQTYCASEGVVTFEWIGNVTIGDFTNTSGGINGFEDYTDLESIELRQGETYAVSFTPAFAGNTYREHFRVWIDYNQNGVFANSNEKAFDDATGSTTTVTGTITIPANAPLGSTRLRVSMAYGAAFGGDYPQNACDSGQDGQVEDYCVTILESNGDTSGIAEAGYGTQFGIEVFPVPVVDVLHLRMLHNDSRPSTVRVIDALGRQVLAFPTTGDETHSIDVTKLGAGVYFIEAIANGATIGRARFVRF